MLSRAIKSASKLSQSYIFGFASTQKAGHLYTWGITPAGLGFNEDTSSSEEFQTPLRLDTFDNNVVQVSMGPHHTAVVTNEGDLYTFGAGAHGSLGHDLTTNSFTPKLVESLRESGVKIAEVSAGESHTAALAENGDLYTFGFGGKSWNPIKNIFNPSFGALGTGKNQKLTVPTLVEDIPAGPKSQVTSGYNFTALLNDHNELYNWGVGRGAVFAEGSQKNIKIPTLNEALHHLLEDGRKIVKIKACANHILALLDDGSLYGWGNNELGQLGIKKPPGIMLVYDEVSEPTRFNDINLQGEKVVDFDVGEEASVILTDKNKVYWSGLKLALEPEQILLPEDIKVKKVAVFNPDIAILTENNELYTTQRQIIKSSMNVVYGIFKVDPSLFNGGQILDIGGSYQNRYAIVQP